jgi:undecaprenyl-diphosphatase
MQNTVISFDRRVAYLVQKLPDWVSPLMNAATAIGYPAVIVSLAALIGAICWFKDKHRVSYAMLASVLALFANSILKNLVHRKRPPTMYVAHMKIHSYSFPSGHAFGAVAFYGLLAYLAFKYLPAPWNILATIALVILVLMIGISRVYLGAHFPSDVLAGWLLGGLALFLIIRFIQP